VCGPAAMMASLVPAIIDWGVPQQDLHYEAFGPASAHIARIVPETPVPILATAVEIHFQRSGRTLAWEGRDESLLEFAERHGIVVDSGCRSGSCGTCETRLISGTVHYIHEPDHDVAPGHCLLCVCIPRSTLVLEA
jgi:ferredoxin